MTYTVKEIFYTLQGEGAHAGRPAVFCRFAGCNLWTGLEKDRATAVCKFCDTDFVGGTKYKTAEDLAAAVRNAWHGGSHEPRYVVCTGGEPLLQLDAPLIRAFARELFEIGVETNGTQKAPKGLDWVCVSPKADAPLVQTHGDELKLVYPQPENTPEQFEDLDFDHFFLQPMDAPYHTGRNTKAAVEYCLQNPKWKLSLQTHKMIGIE